MSVVETFFLAFDEDYGHLKEVQDFNKCDSVITDALGSPIFCIAGQKFVATSWYVSEVGKMEVLTYYGFSNEGNVHQNSTQKEHLNGAVWKDIS